MKITFLGVGEAFDENYPNNSHLLASEKTNLLVDCGDSAVRQLWKYTNDYNLLDAVYISHKHSDHLFGLPALLSRMLEEKRTKPFTIICPHFLFNDIKTIASFAYQGLKSNFSFQLHIMKVKAGRNITFGDLSMSFAPTIHSVKNLAIKISSGQKSYCYSGDGQFIKETEALYKDSDLVIQETYLYNQQTVGHACITDTIEMAKRLQIKALALTHLQRDFRKNGLAQLIDKIKNESFNVLIPEPLDTFSL